MHHVLWCHNYEGENVVYRDIIGSRLRNARELCGKTQRQAAKLIGSTHQKISSFETGRTRIDVETLVLLCDAYKISIDDILRTHVSESIAHTSVIRPEKDALIKKIDRLNEQGCMMLLAYVDFLLTSREYLTELSGELSEHA
jgi:transcriptional regulator with XRE-family HTH domain